ncbi:hypothetical protein ACKKBG_A19110 [Auxenochlorella protothecoides x Auxenochlorella symbiontica]|uniref:CBF1-interacting co-repressor CIR N-terminal domain-containing protein n=1 Tax=Auxenochlorella protothecoides TaxID=3075 RepID=A0A1D1ZR33_AUXPR
MGGHGGLNILPQKRWNVYGRENRLKVAEDEAKHAAEQEEATTRHQAAEAGYRHRMLLARARQRQGMPLVEPDDGAQDALGPGAGEASGSGPLAGGDTGSPSTGPSNRERLQGGPATEDRATALPCPALVPSAAIAPPERFNLFALEEQMSQAKHPEVEAEKRKMVANRGDQKTQTSDAKFDERFKFAHGLTGSSSQPWYTKGGAEPPRGGVPSADLQTWQATALQALGRSHEELIAEDHSAEPRSRGGEGSEFPRPQSLRRSGKRRKKEPKAGKKHRRRDEDRGDGEAAYAAAQADLLVALRAERLEREAAESARQRQVLAAQQAPGPGRGYHNTYGYGRK